MRCAWDGGLSDRLTLLAGFGKLPGKLEGGRVLVTLLQELEVREVLTLLTVFKVLTVLKVYVGA